MANNSIKRGLKVQIEFDAGVRKARVDCYITEPDFDRLTLSFPESKSEFIPYLTEGTELRAFIYTFTGILVINSIIFDSPFDGQFVIEYNEENQIIQRRKYLRMPYITDFFLVGDDGNIKTNTIDIGGGGVRFACNQFLSEKYPYKAQLRISPIDGLIKVEGFVSKKHFYKEEEYLFEFTEISETARNKIIQRCIQIEREQNKSD